MTLRTVSLSALLLIVSTAVPACSRQALRPEPSGFLSEYSSLAPSPELEGALVWRNHARKMSVYKMLNLDPVQIINSTKPGVEVPAQSRQELLTLFQGEIRNVLGQSYPLVDHSGFGVLRVRLAVTNVRGDDSLLGSVDPRLPGLDLNHAVLEAEMLDGQTGDRVMTLVVPTSGRPYRRLAGKPYNTRDDDPIRSWAIVLRDSLDSERGLLQSRDFKLGGM